ncbi:hypothetical protein GCM10020254_08200 [Streptomyces goshikiensis]
MDDQTRFVVGQGLDHLVVGQVALDVEFQGAGMVRVAQDHGVDLPCLLQVLEGIEALFGKGVGWFTRTSLRSWPGPRDQRRAPGDGHGRAIPAGPARPRAAPRERPEGGRTRRGRQFGGAPSGGMP